ncbi:hypothetical protein QBC46DRAFT_218212, partial [Diplogelasinospora grovesii]
QNWDAENLRTTHLESDVQQIHLCALRNELNGGDGGGEPPANHWVLCLQVYFPSSSVTVDMVPGYGSDGLRGKIELTSLDNEPYTGETLRMLSFVPDVKIRDAFDFSPEWEGCRFWMSTLINDLAEHGYI